MVIEVEEVVLAWVVVVWGEWEEEAAEGEGEEGGKGTDARNREEGGREDAREEDK